LRNSIKSKIRILSFVIIGIFMLSAYISYRTSIDRDELDQEKNLHDEILYDEIGLSKYDPPINVSFVRDIGTDFNDLLSSLPGETLEDNRWSRLYQQVLGIQIDYDWTANGDFYRQKLNFAISSGQLPDIIKVSSEQLRLLSNAGLIQELTDVYEKYATPFTKDILNQEGSGPFDAATIGGKLMGIPESNSSIEGAMYIWIRTDWLDRLGLQPPKTMNDVLEISRAFTLRDPDQNGKDDTFGLALTNYLWNPTMGVKGFMAGYNAFPEIWIENEAGELVFGGVQPEVKDALQALRQMYQNGEIDPEFSFMNGNKVKERIANGKIGMVYGEQWASFLVQSSRTSDPDVDWQAFPIVSVSDEPAKVPLKFNTWQFFAVRKDFQHPEAIVKLINLHLEKNWGKTAEYETYYSTPFAAWQLSPVTPFPARKNIDAYRQLEAARYTGDWSELDSEARMIKKLIDTYHAGGANMSSGWGWEKTYGPDGAFSILVQYEENDQLLYEKFTGVPTETMIEAQKILHDLQHEAYINIILGNPIDEFDRFVDRWKKLGGDRITQEVNDWYSQNR